MVTYTLNVSFGKFAGAVFWCSASDFSLGFLRIGRFLDLGWKDGILFHILQWRIKLDRARKL